MEISPVQKIILKNNVTLLLEKTTNSKSASVGFYINKGSINESDTQFGWSHFCEHMIFKGTKNFTNTLKKIVFKEEKNYGQIINEDFTNISDSKLSNSSIMSSSANLSGDNIVTQINAADILKKAMIGIAKEFKNTSPPSSCNFEISDNLSINPGLSDK